MSKQGNFSTDVTQAGSKRRENAKALHLRKVEKAHVDHAIQSGFGKDLV